MYSDCTVSLDKVGAQNSTEYRRVMTLICTFLRMVLGGGKNEGDSPSVRASTQPDTTVGTVRFRTQYLEHFSRSKFLLCPF